MSTEMSVILDSIDRLPAPQRREALAFLDCCRPARERDAQAAYEYALTYDETLGLDE